MGSIYARPALRADLLVDKVIALTGRQAAPVSLPSRGNGASGLTFVEACERLSAPRSMVGLGRAWTTCLSTRFVASLRVELRDLTRYATGPPFPVGWSTTTSNDYIGAR
jgi:hypothetical protein